MIMKRYLMIVQGKICIKTTTANLNQGDIVHDAWTKIDEYITGRIEKIIKIDLLFTLQNDLQ